jgi:triphosphatase
VTVEQPVAEEPSACAADPLRDFACEVVARQVRVLRQSEPGVVQGTDPEFLHDMRVATRRIRAALRMFREELGGERPNRLRGELGGLGKLLGVARDLDVFLGQLPGDLGRVEADPCTARAVRDLVDIRRAEARTELLATLRSEPYLGLVNELEELAGRAAKVRLGRAREAAARRAWKAIGRALRWRKAGNPATSAEALHRLRIDFKLLRYACEFFLDVYASGARGALRGVVAFQDCLGAHQDAVVGIGLLEALGAGLAGAKPEDRGMLLVLGGLLAVKRQDAAQARAQFQEMWPKLPKRLRRLRRKIV